MNTLINTVMALVILFSMATVGKAFHDLNDGRIQTVVKQLVTPQVQSASAKQ